MIYVSNVRITLWMPFSSPVGGPMFVVCVSIPVTVLVTVQEITFLFLVVWNASGVWDLEVLLGSVIKLKCTY